MNATGGAGQSNLHLGILGGMKKLPTRYCIRCGNPIPRVDQLNYCSSACYHEARRGQPCEARKRRITKTCPVCQEEFETGGRAGKLDQIYCSELCAGKALRRGIDNYFKPRLSGNGSCGGGRSVDWRELAAKILDRDKACVFCGRTKNLQVHHLVPREYDGSHDEDNLAASCRRCHMLVDGMIKIMKTKRPDFDIRGWLASFMGKES